MGTSTKEKNATGSNLHRWNPDWKIQFPISNAAGRVVRRVHRSLLVTSQGSFSLVQRSPARDRRRCALQGPSSRGHRRRSSEDDAENSTSTASKARRRSTQVSKLNKLFRHQRRARNARWSDTTTSDIETSTRRTGALRRSNRLGSIPTRHSGQTLDGHHTGSANGRKGVRKLLLPVQPDSELGFVGRGIERIRLDQVLSVYAVPQRRVFSEFRNYDIPVIELEKDNKKEAVCLVFEKVNTGGVPLSVFELVTATYAADGVNLRDEWYGNVKERELKAPSRWLARQRMLKDIQPTDFLQGLSLLYTYQQRNTTSLPAKPASRSLVSARNVICPRPSARRLSGPEEPVTHGLLVGGKVPPQGILLLKT